MHHFQLCSNTYRNSQRVLLTWTGVSGAVEPPTITGAETKRKYQHNYFPVPFFWLWDVLYMHAQWALCWPVVTSIRGFSGLPWFQRLSSVEVQAGTVFSVHTDSPISRQDLPLCTVAPRLTLPLTVLGDRKRNVFIVTRSLHLSFTWLRVKQLKTRVMFSVIPTARSSQERGQEGPQLLNTVPGTCEQGATENTLIMSKH